MAKPRKPKARKRRTHGTGSISQRGAVWKIQFYENGRRRTQSHAKRDDAERVLAKALGDIAQGKTGLDEDPKHVPTLGELVKPWLERRLVTHRNASDDRRRWNLHLEPFFGHLRPSKVDSATIRRFVESKLGSLSSTTVGHCVRLLSTFCSDLVERRLIRANPVRAVPRATRRLYRNAHDPRLTPFLRRQEDIRAVFLALPEPANVAFAVGALGGLRTGEVLGLQWEHIDLENRRIQICQQVRQGRLGPVKDDDSRIAPLLDSLAPILRAFHLRTGGKGLLFKPACEGRGGRPGRPGTFVRFQTLHGHLKEAVSKCKLGPLTWYQATRHTFASQWVLGGGSIEKLKVIMGHESVKTTERYAHLRTDLFREADYANVSVDLSSPAGKLVPMAPGAPNGTRLAPEEVRSDRESSVTSHDHK